MGRDPGEEEQELRLGLGTFLTTGHKIKAATNDWTFDEEFKSVWVTEEDGEPAEYEDPGAWKRRQRSDMFQLRRFASCPRQSRSKPFKYYETSGWKMQRKI